MLDPKRHLAAFDLENTLIASNVVESYSWLATRRLDRGERVRYALRTMAQAPGLLKLDRVDRGDFLRHFYRRYEHAPVEQIEADAQELLTQIILMKSFPAGLRRVREHRALGHRTVLITGALDFAVEGLRPLFDEIVSAEMSVRPDGTLSGEMLQVPPTGETRAQILHDYCRAEGLNIDEAVAYADSTSDLPMLEAVGLPRRRQPRDPPGRHRPQAGLARRALVQGQRRPPPDPPDGPADGRARTPPELPMTAPEPDVAARTERSVAPTVSGWRSGRPQAGSGGRAQRGPSMKALQVRRSVSRLGLARVASALAPSAAVRIGPLEYTNVDPPELPSPAWHRVRTRLAGICGSDLSMIEGHASTYFDDWVSFPFVPGHEVVGELDDGTRVVLEPVLGHEARGFAPPFEGAAPGDGDDYAHLATGHLEPGIQTGFCCSTGGGWAPELIAHDTQLHRLADHVPDERAVLIEPLAGGIHAALKAGRSSAVSEAAEPVVAVLGAGTMGLAAVAGLVRYVPHARVVVGARYPHQQRVARQLGAHDVVPGRRAVPRRAPHRRLPRRRRPPVVGRPRHHRRRRQRGLRPRGPVDHPAPRPRRDDGHAGRGDAGPDRACGTARPSSSAPTPTAPSTSPTAPGSARSTWPWPPPTPSRPSAGCRRPTPSPTTSTPSPTPPPPAGAAPSRSPSTSDPTAPQPRPIVRSLETRSAHTRES